VINLKTYWDHSAEPSVFVIEDEEGNGIFRGSIEDGMAIVREASLRRIEFYRHECMEQARIIAMGAHRELKLITERDRWKACAEGLAESLRFFVPTAPYIGIDNGSHVLMKYDKLKEEMEKEKKEIDREHHE
jgi:hypothetical protein